MNTQETIEADMARLDAARQSLLEHFDTVQIFATRHEPGQHDGTISVVSGSGNWFARLGQIISWLRTNKQ